MKKGLRHEEPLDRGALGEVRTDDLMKKGLRHVVQRVSGSLEVRTDDLMKKGLRRVSPEALNAALFEPMT